MSPTPVVSARLKTGYSNYATSKLLPRPSDITPPPAQVNALGETSRLSQSLGTNYTINTFPIGRQSALSGRLDASAINRQEPTNGCTDPLS